MTYHLASQIVLWIGVTVLAFGFFGDRTRKSYLRIHRGVRLRRCPKCWYDLSHTEGMTCNECGYTAKRERKLHKSRKRWKLVWLAIVIFIGSHALNVTPAVKDRGWPAAVPTTALIVSMPFLRPDMKELNLPVPIWPKLRAFTYNALPPQTDSNQRAIGTPLYKDLLTRIDNEELSDWQSALCGRICDSMKKDDSKVDWRWESLTDHVLCTTHWKDSNQLHWEEYYPNVDIQLEVQTRPVWPVNTPILAKISVFRNNTCPSHIVTAETLVEGLLPIKRFELTSLAMVSREVYWKPKYWSDGTSFIGSSLKAQDNVYYNIRYEQVVDESRYRLRRYGCIREERFRMPFIVDGNPQDVLRPVEGEGVDNLLREALAQSVFEEIVSQNESSFRLTLGDKNSAEVQLYPVSEMTFGFRFEILYCDKIIGEAVAWFEDAWKPGEWCLQIEPSDKQFRIASSDLGKFELRVIGDPQVALRNFDATQYWAGEFIMPLYARTVVPHSEGGADQRTAIRIREFANHVADVVAAESR